MAQRTLNAYVVLNGRVDNGFGRIGAELELLGSRIDTISLKLIDFGKKSYETYRSYEDSMLEAQGALATVYGQKSSELEGVMKDLDTQAKIWASTTIFHTNDVANAISEAAHASWDYEKIIAGIPAAMKLAQAGGLSLSQGLDYVITTANGAGIAFEDLDRWIDVWTFSANSSAGTIEEFGDAMQKMGSTMQFTDSMEELVTLLAVLHSNGTKGAAAGTLLRNTMLRLIAPSQKAQEVMSDLEITEEELEEAIGGDSEALNEAMKALEAVGFSVYDANGNLKPMIRLFTELYSAMDGMTEEKRNGILTSIFPTRTVTGALAFLRSASNGFEGLYEAMEAGDAEGYGQYLSELMMSGLTGSVETLISKYENLELLVGETLAPKIKEFSGILGGMLDNIANLPEEQFNALIGGLTGLAIAGPALGIAGFALSTIGSLLTPTGAIALGAATLATLVGALSALEETNYKNSFGDMRLEMDALGKHVVSLGNKYDSSFERVSKFSGALETSVTNYRNASTEFSSRLLSNIVTGTTFTPEEKEALETLGINIYSEVLAGIQAGGDASAEFWNVLYGGDEISAKDPRYQQIIDLLQQGQEESVKQAGAIFEKIKAAMLEGYEKGFTPEDYETILGYFEEYNALVAQAQAKAATEEQLVQQEMMLRKAQTASIEDVQALSDQAREQRDADLAEYTERYEGMRARLKAEAMLYKDMSREEAEAYLAELGVDAEYQQTYQRMASNYDEMLLNLWMIALSQQEGGDLYSRQRAIDMMEAAFGGPDEIARRIEYYDSIGNKEMASRFMALNPSLYMDLATGETGRELTEQAMEDALKFSRNIDTFLKAVGENAANVESMQQVLYAEEQNELASLAFSYGMQYDLKRVFDELMAARPDMQSYFDMNNNSGYQYAALWSLLYGPASQNAEEYAKRNPQFVEFKEIEPGVFTLGDENQLGAEMEITNATEATQEALEEAQEYANQNPLFVEFKEVAPGVFTLGDGQEVPEMASGGRETRPALFAEAGIPEWFIPEEHTANTARLILGAAYGSGFNIYDLAALAGARLFADGGTTGPLPSGSVEGYGGGIQVSYSPVIHADDARGVSRVLREDKTRLRRMLEDLLAEREQYRRIVGF